MAAVVQLSYCACHSFGNLVVLTSAAQKTTKMRTFLASAVLLAIVTLSISQQQTFQLPSGAELFVSNYSPDSYQPSLSCQDKKYGYYADVAAGCQVFHVCVPITDEAGAVVETYQYSFFCGNQTLFNQQSLACDHADNVDCSVAESFYSVNDEFGKIPPARGGFGGAGVSGGSPQRK